MPKWTFKLSMAKNYSAGDILLVGGIIIVLDRALSRGEDKTLLGGINNALDKAADSIAGVFPDAKKA